MREMFALHSAFTPCGTSVRCSTRMQDRKARASVFESIERNDFPTNSASPDRLRHITNSDKQSPGVSLLALYRFGTEKFQVPTGFLVLPIQNLLAPASPLLRIPPRLFADMTMIPSDGPLPLPQAVNPVEQLPRDHSYPGCYTGHLKG